jgi:radial spoke head protein 4A
VLIEHLAFGPWVELPVITPKHILMARKIKHIFTGNLEANIITNPFFFGKEKHYVIIWSLKMTNLLKSLKLKL